MTYRYSRHANDELMRALLWYDCKRKGTGLKLLLEIEATIERILGFPEIGMTCGKQCRKCRVSDFPFNIIYRIQPTEIEIVSVFNVNRAPEAWRKNL